jgi:hypothetical protein
MCRDALGMLTKQLHKAACPFLPCPTRRPPGSIGFQCRTQFVKRPGIFTGKHPDPRTNIGQEGNQPRCCKLPQRITYRPATDSKAFRKGNFT